MSAFLMRMSDFFCPSDRELALRGQIKTGWSTVAARKKSRPSQMKLPPQEVKHIEAVVAQAEALQVAEEIRIGVQMLKLQRLRNSCRGNGTSSCILCGYDLVHHRSRSLSSMHVCFECAQAVCSRCKAEYKCHTGETVVLCRLCSDERELWKKSGAWLSNKLPVVNISEEELERAQQQRQMAQKMMPLRTNFMVPPSQLDEEEDDEDDLSTVSGSTANYGGYPTYIAGSAPSSRSPSPDLSFMTEANAAAAAWRGDRQTSELLPQSHKTLPPGKSPTVMRKSGSYDLVATRRLRASTMPSKERVAASITRKPAMGGERKKDMEELRRKVIEKKKAADLQKSVGRAIQRTPSPTLPTLSVDPLKMKRSRSNDFPLSNPRLSPMMAASSQHPYIKVVMATPPTSPDIPRGELRSQSPLTESTVAREPTPKSQEPRNASATSGSAHDPSPSTSQQPEGGRRRKPVPSPRRRPASPDPLSTATTTTTTQGTHDARDFTFVAEGKKYATIEREKPSAAPQKRTASVEKERGREHRSGTLERRQRASRTPEPQSPPSRNSTRKTPPPESKSTFSSIFPADVNSELQSALYRKKASRESSKEEAGGSNPHLKDIGKRVSITSEGSVDSQQGTVGRTDSGSSGDHTWKRQGARRTAGRARRTQQTEADEEDQGTRHRTRSGAVSGGGGGGARRTHHQGTEEEEQGATSRSRTRSGAVSGSDPSALRRGRNARASPRPGHRRVSREHSAPRDDPDSFPEPSEQFGSEEAECIRRARAGDRRAARTGGDLLVAADGEDD
jgi:hypothetical protein